jgi:hypothetical protein
MIVEALKDVDGDYWIPVNGGDLSCLTREGYIDGGGNISPDLLAVSEFGPFATVRLSITETDVPS